MKKIIYILFLSGFLLSCDDREKYIQSLDVAPKFTYENGLNYRSDSIKLSLKHSQVRYSASLNLSDLDNNLKDVTFKSLSSGGKIYIDDVVQTSNTFSVNKPIFKFSYEPKTIGYNRMTLTASDKFNKVSSISLELYGFDNLAPVSVFSKANVTKLGVLNNLEYQIDATGSYDADQKFGGTIVQYKFKINSDEYFINVGTLKTIFPKEGSYSIEVSVLDNDGAWSKVSSDIVDIN